MNIKKLLLNVVVSRISNFEDIEASGVAIDTREDCHGKVFICIAGRNYDTHLMVRQAEAKGAVALITERAVNSCLPTFIVKNTRKALGVICGNFYNNPANAMNIITVVGTNGKTTTTHLLSKIFREAGYSTATIGTLGYEIGGDWGSSPLTTPDPIDLHKVLAKMKAKGVEYVFLEASAHAIYLEKLAGIRSKATILTNVTQDHLDYFNTMEEYTRVKFSYFDYPNTALAIINSDDEAGRKLLRSTTVPSLTYGINNPADVFAINIEKAQSGLSFTLNAFDCILKIKSHLHGLFNVYNIMSACAVAVYMGIGTAVIEEAILKIQGVLGRYDVQMVGDKRVIIDYAHTPDGLENLLKEVKDETTGKVITVFGCGGNRDTTKRSIMGEVASKYSDYIIVTNDNPRYEDEYKIAQSIMQGISCDVMTTVEVDRAKAVKMAVEYAGAADTVVLAGKGHEDYMEKNGGKIRYSDYETLEKLRMV